MPLVAGGQQPADRPGHSVGELLTRAAALQSVSDSPELDTQLLLAEVLGCSRASLLAHPERLLDETALQRFAGLLARRQQGEPLAYLLGRRGFWDFELQVDRRVLIPRPETELLVEKALDCLAGRQHEPLRLLDLGAGSGAIAIALARHSRHWQVTASDCSAASLALARDNARALQVTNIEFVQSSWLDAFHGRHFELIVSNPPYIDAADPHLRRDGLPYEPAAALVAAEQGLACLREIVTQAHHHLRPGGWLLLEHGYDQGAALAGLLAQAGYRERQQWQDMAGLDRVAVARFRQSP